MRNLLAAILLLAAPSAGGAAELAIYPMVDCATPGATHIEIHAPMGLCLSPTPVLTERDFSHLQRLQYVSPFLRADLKPEARRRYYDFALAHRLSFAAIRVDSHTTRIMRVVPLIQPAWFILSGGRMSYGELDAVADDYRARFGHT